jgi:hypothetical protein
MTQLQPEWTMTRNAAGVRAEQTHRFSRFHTDLAAQVQDIRRHGTERAQAESVRAADFVAKMISAQSAVAAIVCQDWPDGRAERAVEDAHCATEAGRIPVGVITRLRPGRTMSVPF